MSKIELGKKYKTKSGLNVEILKTDVNNVDGYSVVGIVTLDCGSQSTDTWLEDGQFLLGEDSGYDLVEVKETKEMWLEVYKYNNSHVFISRHLTKQEATFNIDQNKSDPTYQFIALKRVVYSEGDTE